MRGSFRRDSEMQPDASSPGAFKLVRKSRARGVSYALIGVSLLAALYDLFLQNAWLVLAQLLLFGGFIVLHLIAEARSWRFGSDQVVVRTLELPRLRVREEKLSAGSISRVGIAREGSRARAWLELKDGTLYAMVEGEAAEVERIAGAVQRAVLLAGLEAKGQTLH